MAHGTAPVTYLTACLCTNCLHMTLNVVMGAAIAVPLAAHTSPRPPVGSRGPCQREHADLWAAAPALTAAVRLSAA